MNKQKSNKIKENAYTVRHMWMGHTHVSPHLRLLLRSRRSGTPDNKVSSVKFGIASNGAYPLFSTAFDTAFDKL